MERKPIDLTEFKLKKKFIENVNDHIRCYNQCDESFHKYHESALCCLQTLADLFGWSDVGVLICVECKKIWDEANPEPISI